MQDSFEEYLRMSRNSREAAPDKISKEMIVTAQLKKECDVRALKIVEFSIEGKLRPEVFTRCLPFINKSHYTDIVEERALAKLCGYSICGKRIPEMPKKQYFISTTSNKVYDITERKNFCSNFCYKASLHIQNQIDNSLLWLRKLEDIPEYTYLHSSESGLPGKYIDQGIVEVKPVQDVSFTSINTFAGVSLDDILDKNAGKSKNKKTKGFQKSSRLHSTMQTIKENEIEEEIQVSLSETSTKKGEEKRSHKIVKKDNHHHKMSCVVSLPSIEENEEKVLERLQNVKEIKENIQENNQDVKNERTDEQAIMISDNIQEKNRQTGKETKVQIKSEPPERNTTGTGSTNKVHKQTKKKPKAFDVEGLIKKALDEWLTIDTCIFIHGEEKLRHILNEKKLSDYFEQLKVAELQREQQIRYMEVCRRLQLQEMAEDKFDRALVGGQKLNPLPDYRKLKEDTKDMTLKVKSFYDGAMYEQDDKNFPVAASNSESDGAKPEESPPAVLPPVDANSQNLLRRKIFLNSLNKATQQVLQSLGIPYFSAVLSDIRGLVKTFNLKADNITFKPILWSYVALVLLSVLSLRDSALKEVLEQRRSQEYIKLLLATFPNKKSFIDDVLNHMRNIEGFVERYITNKDKDSHFV